MVQNKIYVQSVMLRNTIKNLTETAISYKYSIFSGKPRKSVDILGSTGIGMLADAVDILIYKYTGIPTFLTNTFSFPAST